MKCKICGEKIKTIFLNKILGTYIKDKKGKQVAVCSSCQKKLGNDKEKILTEAQ
jgi:Zn-finger protein